MDDDDDEPKGPKMSVEAYKAEGDAFFIIGEYNKAIQMYSTALETAPGQRDCLVARSRCHLKLGDISNALKDAEESLKEDSTFHRGLYQKAETLFYKGDFEQALVFYHRGNKLRPELHEFGLGVQKAEDAIDYAAGSSKKVALTTEGDLSFFTEQTQRQVVKKKAPSKRPVGLFGRQVEEKKALKRSIKRTARAEATLKKVMGQLYPDRVYLENLMQETDENSDMGKKILQIIESGLQYLDTRTEFWRQQMPIYAREHELRMRHRGRSNVGIGVQAWNFIALEMEKIERDQNKGDHQKSLLRCEKLMHTLSKYGEDEVPNLLELKATLLATMGDASMELKRNFKALQYHTQALEMGKENDMDNVVSRGLDSVGRVYARMGKFKQAIEYWERKVGRTETAQERAWLFHELGRCYLELKQYQKAMAYGSKAYNFAQEAGDRMWKLQAFVLLAQVEAKMLRFDESLELFQAALDLAKEEKDEKFVDAITKVMYEVKDRKLTMEKIDATVAEKLAFDAVGRQPGAPVRFQFESDDETEESAEEGEGRGSADKEAEHTEAQEEAPPPPPQEEEAPAEAAEEPAPAEEGGGGGGGGGGEEGGE